MDARGRGIGLIRGGESLVEKRKIPKSVNIRYTCQYLCHHSGSLQVNLHNKRILAA